MSLDCDGQRDRRGCNKRKELKEAIIKKIKKDSDQRKELKETAIKRKELKETAIKRKELKETAIK
ncbi:MAG: hypothetical protein LBC41_04725 [Clostridiales bacterium]|nr:hypothetical protein [Clostridiales bacterium]